MPEAEQSGSRTWRPPAEGIAAAVAMCVFALFIGRGGAWRALSFLSLLAVAVSIWRSLRAEPSLARLFGVTPVWPAAPAYVLAGVAIGVGLGAAYRASVGAGFFPPTLRRFVVVAAAIGAAEELVYRGYIQGRMRRLGILGAIASASLCHTAYKCALFVFPLGSTDTDLAFLAVYTFLGGLVFGALRDLSKSVIPPLAAHVFFDIIVYGDLLDAPPWVWR